MDLFTLFIRQPVIVGIATLTAVVMVILVLRSVMTAERRDLGWVRAITGVNGRLFFGLLFITWAVVSGVGLILVPHTGANSPYGGLALISLFTGSFIMFGLLWAIIGD